MELWKRRRWSRQSALLSRTSRVHAPVGFVLRQSAATKVCCVLAGAITYIHWSGLRNSERRAHRRFGGVVLSARSAVSIASNCSRWACFILPDRTAQNCAFRATKAQICRDDLILFWDSLLSAIVRGAEITLLDVTDYGAEILDTLACVG